MVAALGIAAILLACTGIISAYVELNGTRELDAVLADAPPIRAEAPQRAPLQSAEHDESRDAAVASGRWAAGFSL